MFELNMGYTLITAANVPDNVHQSLHRMEIKPAIGHCLIAGFDFILIFPNY